MNKSLFRSISIITLVLLIPVIPFLIFGPQCEAWLTENIIENPALKNTPAAIGAVILTLATDILLPVPSSGVMAFAGATTGTWTGTLASWIGLNLSCATGFVLGRWFGLPLAQRLSSESELTAMKSSLNLFGPWILVSFRALPVLAEASVLVSGVYKMSPARFWPPVLISNLAVATAYCALGELAENQGWFGLGFIVSLIAPLLILLVWLLIAPRFARDSNNAVEGDTGITASEIDE